MKYLGTCVATYVLKMLIITHHQAIKLGDYARATVGASSLCFFFIHRNRKAEFHYSFSRCVNHNLFTAQRISHVSHHPSSDRNRIILSLEFWILRLKAFYAFCEWMKGILNSNSPFDQPRHSFDAKLQPKKTKSREKCEKSIIWILVSGCVRIETIYINLFHLTSDDRHRRMFCILAVQVRCVMPSTVRRHSKWVLVSSTLLEIHNYWNVTWAHSTRKVCGMSVRT